MDPNSPLLTLFTDLAARAGQAVMAWHGRTDLPVTLKEDESPLSAADLEAHGILTQGLGTAFPDIPLVSEENETQLKPAQAGPRFFLIDPIDGTKAFVRGSPEFTLNVALIEQGKPTAGLLYAPALGRLFLAEAGQAWELALAPGGQAGPARQLSQVAPQSLDSPRVLTSALHRSARGRAFMEAIPNAQLRALSSSLKFGLIAAGEGDFYPRYGPTNAWDTAAGQAILDAAGGQVLSAETHAPLRYGHDQEGLNWANPAFLALAHPDWLGLAGL